MPMHLAGMEDLMNKNRSQGSQVAGVGLVQALSDATEELEGGSEVLPRPSSRRTQKKSRTSLE